MYHRSLYPVVFFFPFLILTLSFLPFSIATAQNSSTQKEVASTNQVQIVVSEGLGADVTSAAQNAAQNALTNVVGSFMDSNKVLEKRVEIQDGVRSQSSRIDTNIKEYSQGSIQRFEILEVSEQAGLTKVTAKISVRIEDFKAFIKKLAEGKTDVEAGLFSSLSTDKNQKVNLEKIIIDLINPVVKGEVSRFEIGKPVSMEEAKEQIMGLYFNKWEKYADGVRKRELQEYSIKLDQFVATRHPDLVVYIPVKVVLDQGFYENAFKTLENTAGGKSKFKTDDYYHNYGQINEVDAILGFGEIQSTSLKVSVYLLKGIYQQLAKEFPWFNWISKSMQDQCRGLIGSCTANTKPVMPLLGIEVIDLTGHVIKSYDIENRQSSEEDVKVISDFRFPGPAWNLLVSPDLGNGIPIIMRNREFGILMALDESTLKNAKEIKLKLLPY